MAASTAALSLALGCAGWLILIIALAGLEWLTRPGRRR